IIPVVVHVMYNRDEQNISAAQIKSQIDILNKDFRRLNADAVNTPASFRELAADTYIEFRLAAFDPQGKPSSGVVRRKTNIEYFGIDDRIKSSAIGGDDAWDASKYLNIWTCNLTGGVIGYASLLGGPAAQDGVVIRFNAFGLISGSSTAFGKGRTATHEIGHWLGLRHIWGDEYCGNDNIDDTPPQQGPSRGCPSGIVTSCNNSPEGIMYMNFMDFTNDECVNMFTFGQAQKIRAVFNEGAPRYDLLMSDRANGIPLEDTSDLVAPPAGEINIYPNPSFGQLTIRFRSTEEGSNRIITIYNQLGQAVKQLRATGQQTILNTSGLKNGTYYLKADNSSRALKFTMAVK
ncbi:MAG: M43 family zinc metalloprotease, partial [Flavitalea sp.]